MKLDKATRSELLKMAVYQAGVALLICLAWLVMGEFHWTVITGAFYGAAVALAYFYAICVSVTRQTESVTEENLEQKQKAAKSAVHNGYMMRMLLMLAALLVAFKSPYMANIPAAIPFFLVRPIASLNNPFEYKEEKSK